MKGFVADIEELTEDNERLPPRALHGRRTFSWFVMSLAPGEEIGEEVHEDGRSVFSGGEGQG